VRAGTQRQMDVYDDRKLCDIADQYAEGHVRFTIRSNIEFMVSSFDKVQPLIEARRREGFPVGGTGNSVIDDRPHAGLAALRHSGDGCVGVVKALMDELYEEFRQARKCPTGCTHDLLLRDQLRRPGDIAINMQHTKPPKINHDLVANMCERPSVVARCPVAAIRPALVNGKPSLEVDEAKCICCGACYPPCPPMQINDPEHSKFAIWVGGKNSNARARPTFMKMVAAGLPNNPPRWPEVSEVVKKILYTYKEDARPGSGSDWVERIGWPRFFEKTGCPSRST
jgi:dissimilatory sulfite reductase beta subunit